MRPSADPAKNSKSWKKENVFGITDAEVESLFNVQNDTVRRIRLTNDLLKRINLKRPDSLKKLQIKDINDRKPISDEAYDLTDLSSSKGNDSSCLINVRILAAYRKSGRMLLIQIPVHMTKKGITAAAPRLALLGNHVGTLETLSPPYVNVFEEQAKAYNNIPGNIGGDIIEKFPSVVTRTFPATGVTEQIKGYWGGDHHFEFTFVIHQAATPGQLPYISSMGQSISIMPK